MEKEKIYQDSTKKHTYTVPTNEAEIRRNLINFNNVCNEIFSDKEKWGHLFYTEEQIEKLKSDPKLCEELNIKFI